MEFFSFFTENVFCIFLSIQVILRVVKYTVYLSSHCYIKYTNCDELFNCDEYLQIIALKCDVVVAETHA